MEPTLSPESLEAVNIAITALFVGLLGIALWLGGKAVRYLCALVGIKESDRFERLMDSVITAGIHLADEYAHKKAKGLLAGGPTTPVEKLEVAKGAARSLAPAALKDVGDEKLEMLIEAKLQSMRPWRPTSGSLPPLSFSLPPPAPLPSIPTPLPPKAR